MFQKRIIRLLIAVALVLPVAFLCVAAGQADTVPVEVPSTECEDCHDIVQSHWAESAHANSVGSESFQLEWNSKGQPRTCFACHTTGYDSDTGTWEVSSVSCTTCHNPAPADHPDQIMPTDVSSRLCGECHLDTYSEWTTSTHGEENLACVRCHNPHTNEIRTTDSQQLCSTCHTEEVHFFQYTAHYEEGLLCIDCHVRVQDGPMGEGHGRREHTFEVDMETCSRCHSDEMHFPIPGVSAPPVDSMNAADPLISTLDAAPDPVSPLGFAIVATLVGTALGMILAPWSENWMKRSKS